MLPSVMAGILDKAYEMTAFLNPTENSYARFGKHKAPAYVSWSKDNRSQLLRIPAVIGENKRAELRSPDPTANPYLVFTLLIYAGLYGIENNLKLPEPADFNLLAADAATLLEYRMLPTDLTTACRAAAGSAFIRSTLPEEIRHIYISRRC